MRRAASLIAVLCASLAPAAPAFGSAPWEPDTEYDTEGPYIVEGTGPPGARVQLVEDLATWVPYSNAPSNLDEQVSPTGHFRIDEGSCRAVTGGASDCEGGGDHPYRLVFYRLDQQRVPIWAPNSYFREEPVGSVTFSFPEVEHVQRSARKYFSATGPGSLPAYTSLSGTLRRVPPGGGAPVALPGVKVEAYTPDGYGPYAYRPKGTLPGPSVGDSASLSDGTYAVRVPPGQWALRFTPNSGDPYFPGYVWSGCTTSSGYSAPGTPPPAGTTIFDTAATTTTGDLTLGDGTCNGSTVTPPSGGGGGSPGGGSAGGGSPPAATSPATAGAPTLSPSQGAVQAQDSAGFVKAGTAKNGKDGSATIAVGVSGPGTVSATAKATVKAALISRKAKTRTVTAATRRLKTSRAGSVKLVLKPSATAKKLIRKLGKLKTVVKIRFKPAAGPVRETSRTVTFKKPSAKKPKKRRS